MPPQRDLLLITGIPGTGKTKFGEALEKKFGFAHFELEEPITRARCTRDPAQFIVQLLQDGRNVVITWGFVPNDQNSVSIVLQFKDNGFKLIWFDGNRCAALNTFQDRAKADKKSDADFYYQMYEFYLQMHRIEKTRIVETMRPAIINPLDSQEKFKSPAELLEEIRRA